MTELVKIGEVVEGRYKIVRPIADGGMGTVYLAEHWLIRRKVALKVLHADLAKDAVMIRRFMNEALAAGTLGHPNIVESTDMGFTKNDVPYIVFEYLEGTVLSDEIARVGILPLERALPIAHQIASALDAAHRANIVHRDLKSDNIFLVKKRDVHDHVKVLDFGISRFLAASDRTAAGGSLLGTPEFMAPEQVLAPDRVDHRIDIYALGILLYEMLSGSVPFVLERPNDVEAAHALLARVVHESPPQLAPAGAPTGFATLIEKLLAKNPDARYQTMAEVQRAIEAIAGDALARTSAPPSRPSSPRLADIAEQTLTRSRLVPEDVAREVQLLGKRWSLDGEELVLALSDPQLSKLGSVVATAARIADEMDVQPRIAIDGTHLLLVLADAASVVDLVFAARLEQWLRDTGW